MIPIQKHFKKSTILQKTHNNLCSYSEKYNIALVLIPKSGSSTGRHSIREDLDGVDISHRDCERLPSNVLKVAIVRDPFDRFLSSYDEMFVRHVGRPITIPPMYRKFALEYEGYSYANYSALFDTDVPRLTRSFEQFVRDYDGVDVFDTHLQLQYKSIQHHGITVIKTIPDMELYLAKISGKKIKFIHGRSYKRRFDVSALSQDTIDKICDLVYDDYIELGLSVHSNCQRGAFWNFFGLNY